MKKLNRKGFTLIELLAVITIMGILMLVAIPAVSRTIENSRRDTFMNIAKEYVSAVRNGMLADNIHCSVGTDSQNNEKYVPASALPQGTYYFPICTSAAPVIAGCTADMENHTKSLMESGGTSPFGGADMVGYVQAKIEDDGDKGYTSTSYSVLLADTGNHGLSRPYNEKEITRQSVLLKGALQSLEPVKTTKSDSGVISVEGGLDNPTKLGNVHICKLAD